MSDVWKRVILFAALAVLANVGLAQEGVVDLTVCDLATRPKLFDGKTIRVRGALSVYFEDFSLGVRNCDTQQGIWLAFGGEVPGIVAFTANDTFRKPGVDVKIEGVSYGITKDENLRRLYALIAARHGDKPVYRVTATLTGKFLAGDERKLPNGRSDLAGYGHLGCCALLVITQVSDVESIPRADLTVRGTVVGPDGKPVEGFVVLNDVLGGFPPCANRPSRRQKERSSSAILVSCCDLKISAIDP